MTMSSLDQDLASFLTGLQPACTGRVSWRGGQIELEHDTFLTDRESPPSLTSSGRCIVLSGDRVLVMTNPTDTHILPGGRIEPGESIMAATRREVREETGLELAILRQIGVLVFRHLTPKPPAYRYPYPVFLNTIFVAEAMNPGDLLVNDTYEMSGEFVAHAGAEPRIAEYQRILLSEAVSRNADAAP